MYNTVTNEGKEDQTLEYISSFSYWGIEKEQKEGIPELVSSDDKMSMVVVHNGWQKELTVKKYRFADLGMAQTQPHNYQRTSKTIEITNTGNWSAKEYVPMGYIGNSAADSSLFLKLTTVVPGIMRSEIRTAILSGGERSDRDSVTLVEEPEAGRFLYNGSGGCRRRS